MILNKDSILNTFDILMSRHQNIVSNYATIKEPTIQDTLNFKKSSDALLIYLQSRSDMIDSWSK